jgi:long-chain acyl-CoA synthetase
MGAETIPHLLQGNARHLASHPAYHVRSPEGWQATSWATFGAEVGRVGAALVALGVEPGTPVGVLGANRPEWVIFHAGAMSAGAVPAGIYATSSAAEIQWLLNHSEAPVLLVDGEAQWEKVAAIRGSVPHLRHVVTMRGVTVSDPLVLSWEAFLAKGKGQDEAVAGRLDALRPESLATLIYTSGTTGQPKGVMLTHDNLAWTATQAGAFLGAGAKDRVLSYLPLSHIAEQMLTIHAAAAIGYSVYYAESLEKLRDNLVEVRPTIFFGVPRVWEKFHAGVSEKLAEATGAKAKLATRATAVGRQVTALRAGGKPVPRPLEAQYRLFDKLVYHKVKAALGLDQARICASGAAPVAKEILEFLAGFGLPVHEVYGQSEGTGPTSFNAPGRTRFGTVGPALPGVEVKIASDAEILVRGRNVFAGYYRDPAATAETLVDGWLHSGDLGAFDADGFLSVTGRKKDIIITAGGKNIAPRLIEDGLRAHPLVAEAVCIGDRRRFLTALVALDPEAALRFLQERGLTGPAAASAEVQAELQRVVDGLNGTVARVEQVKKFAVLPRDLSIAEGELTPTLKVKRNVVNEKYEDRFDALYSG